MKIYSFLLIVLCFFGGCSSFENSKKEQITQISEKPKYWLWLGYKAEDDYHVICKKMSDAGIKGLLLSASIEGYKKVIPIAEQYGIQVHAWRWIMNCVDSEVLLKHPEWLSVNREGKSLAQKKAYVDYYKFLCPTLPEVRVYLQNQFREICRIPGLKGVSLDYCRYVDVILPKGLWKNYNIIQDKEYAQWDYGYHPHTLKKFQKQYGYNPLEKKNPEEDIQWLQFRCDQITEIALLLREIAHQYQIPISASPFPTPSMAKKMVRQDWGKWKLDFAFPMIYHKFYLEDERWIINCVKEDVALGMPIYCGLHVPDFQNKEDLKLTEMIQRVLDHGAQGVALYSYEALTEVQWRELTEFIKKHP